MEENEQAAETVVEALSDEDLEVVTGGGLVLSEGRATDGTTDW